MFVHPMSPGGHTAQHLSPTSQQGGNPLANQRAAQSLALIRQRALANAIHGGMSPGGPQAPPSPGVLSPHGIPMIK